MKNFFYNRVFWNHTIAFADIFNDLEIWNYDSSGKAVGSKKVPIKLTPKEKIISAIKNNKIEIESSNMFPMISISWNGLQLDTERMKGQRHSRKLYVHYKEEEGIEKPLPYLHTDFQTVPYKMTFEITVWCTYMDHLTQIIENINTFVHPEMYIHLFEKGIGATRKVKVQRISDSPNFVYDIDKADRRMLQWNSNWEMEVNMYKPENPIAHPIRKITTNLIADGAGHGERIVTEQESDYGDYGDYVDYVDLDKKIVSKIEEYSLEDEFGFSEKYGEKFEQLSFLRDL